MADVAVVAEYAVFADVEVVAELEVTADTAVVAENVVDADEINPYAGPINLVGPFTIKSFNCAIYF